MLFNSFEFFPFIIIVLTLYYFLPFRGQNWMLLIASAFFYGSWDWRFLGLLIVSTAIDFVVGIMINQSQDLKTRKYLMTASIIANLGILGFFKYFNFFIESANAGLSMWGFNLPFGHLEVILPLGISFYTFHAMSYSIDIYRGNLKPIRNFADYMLFVLYFPQLVAGPIARASLLIPQVCHPRILSYEKINNGITLIIWGFFKKMVIADNLAPVVNQAFGGTNQVIIPSGMECLIGIYAFAFQIYCDFSGYTDIARGLAKMMGFELSTNFNLPYLATCPPDFWKRWHISLSSWLKDYLYIPLGGNRFGNWITFRNLLLTMILGGLWHGAAWNFIIWGTYHGLILVFHRIWFELKNNDSPKTFVIVKQFFAIIGMFHLTCLGWLFFRSNSISQILGFISAITFDIHLNKSGIEMLFSLLVFGGALWVFEWYIGNAEDVQKKIAWNWIAGPIFVSFLLTFLWLFGSNGNKEFLYFQF
jgi:alginate O-acetyltransferase complex protein AlgI